MTAYSQNRYDGRVFAAENFLSWQTLVTLAGIKRQFLELLASIGFVPVEIGPGRGGYDNILSVTGPEVSNNWPCFNAVLTAWTFVRFPCIVFMSFTEQIQYTLSIYLSINTHILSLILLKRLWLTLWCWKLALIDIQCDAEKPGYHLSCWLRICKIINGHIYLLQTMLGTKMLHLLLGSTWNVVEHSNLRFIFVQYNHDFTWI